MSYLVTWAAKPECLPGENRRKSTYSLPIHSPADLHTVLHRRFLFRPLALALRAFISLVLLASAVLAASAQPTSSPAPLDYSAFRVITDRNIFNPHRYARSSRDRREIRPGSRVEAFTLVGTMSYEKGPFAFFDGTRSEYRKVVKPEDTIAGYKITNIAPAAVKLASATNEVELAVGMQLRRVEDGEWQVAAAPETPRASPPPLASARPPSVPTMAPAEPPVTGTNGEPPIIVIDPASETVVADSQAEAGGTNGAPEAASGASDDPVLRRLMQRREQEMNR